MTSIFEIAGWQGLASFLIWTLAVVGGAKALFGSFLMAEIRHRVNLSNIPKRKRIQELSWELRQGLRFDRDVIRKSPHANAVKLTEAEMKAKQKVFAELSAQSWPERLALYLFSCWACQSFWTAVILFVLTRGLSEPLGMIVTSLAYSAASVILTARLPVIGSSKEKGCPGGNCGSSK